MIRHVKLCWSIRPLAALLLLILLCGGAAKSAADKVAAVTSAQQAPPLELTLQRPSRAVHPGEIVKVGYAIRNASPKVLLLVINQGDSGGHYAAKTLQVSLANPTTGKWLPVAPMCGCPVGEGLDKRHFRRLRSGEKLEGTITLYWPVERRVPQDIARGKWRLRVQYVRGADMSGGQVDSKEAAQLWRQADVASSAPVEIDVNVDDWGEKDTQGLARRIKNAEAEAMRVAYHAELQAVFPVAKEALFDLKRFPVGHHYDFRCAAVSYLRVVPFEQSSSRLLDVVREQRFDGIYHVKHLAVVSLASYPPEVVGPWAIGILNDNRGNRRLQDAMLSVLRQRKYQTNDPGVIGYMQKEVWADNIDTFSSATAFSLISTCVALGLDNTREVLDNVRRRINDIKVERRRKAVLAYLERKLSQ